MRYIDHARLRKPNGWTQKALAASQAVNAGEDPNDHAEVWRELKDALADLLHDKCWYCESWVDRSDNAVDHFRPKNSVQDAVRPHTGYRWLAFDSANFRYACTYCNSRRKDLNGGTAGGKADRFPLVSEATRVYTPGPLTQEQPLLLDPCDFSDWRLLGCQQENGAPCPTSTDALARKRAEVSIEIYHLNYEPTCKKRHAVAVRLMADIDEAKRLFEQATHDPGREIEFKNVAARIKRAVDRDAIFSGDMHFLLRGQRSAGHPWIDEVLEA